MTARAQHDYLKIAGGTVYDPANGIDGAVCDLWISGGKIVAVPSDPAVRPARTLDARGLVVMPGGIDMHCHIAGPKVNLARRMRPEDRRAAEPLARPAGFAVGRTAVPGPAQCEGPVLLQRHVEEGRPLARHAENRTS